MARREGDDREDTAAVGSETGIEETKAGGAAAGSRTTASV